MLNKSIIILTQLTIVSVVFASSVFAVTLPQSGAIGERSKQTLKYYELQKRLGKAKDKVKNNIVDESAAKETVAPVNEKKIYINKIIIDQSDILTQHEIRNVIASYEGRDVTITELFAVIKAINKLYKDKNYLSAKAVLPPQKVENGVIKIKLIESRVGNVIIENNENTRESFITDRIGVNKGALVQLDHLESELFYFNSVNDIKIRAVLKPGKEFGTTDYIFQAEEPPHYQATFFVDNTGTNETGRERGGVNFINNSLTHNRDVFTAGANFTQGIKSAFISYNVPINTWGTRLGVSADYTDIEVIDGALEALDITGESYNVGGFITHPFKVSNSLILNGFVGLNRKSSHTDFDGVRIFKTDVGTVSFGVDFQHFWGKGPLYSRHVITISGDGFLESDQGFTKYNGELSKIIAMDNNVTALIRFSGQLSDTDLLPSSEQFQVGGMSTVRGYPTSLLLGDEGYFSSIEIGFPLPLITKQLTDNPYMDKWRGLVFIDHGAAFPFKGNNAKTDSSDFLTSVGAGINVNIFNGLSARLILAVPLKDREDGEDKLKLHFYIQYTPFS